MKMRFFFFGFSMIYIYSNLLLFKWVKHDVLTIGFSVIAPLLDKPFWVVFAPRSPCLGEVGARCQGGNIQFNR